MGLTLIAILTAAFLLPGIAATRAFFQVARTSQVDPLMPSLSQPEGIVYAGIFSIAVHCLYITILGGLRTLQPVIPFPLADPYSVFALPGPASLRPDHVLAVALGLLWLSFLAILCGWALGAVAKRWGDKEIFYGPLADILAAKRDDSYFVMAYVLTKLEKDGRAIGYQGTLRRLLPDEQRYPAKLVLEDASIFYLDFEDEGPVRREAKGVIDWIALSAEEWSNVAFRVFRVVDDEQDGGDTPALPPGSILPAIATAIGAVAFLGERLHILSPRSTPQRDGKDDHEAASLP